MAHWRSMLRRVIQSTPSRPLYEPLLISWESRIVTSNETSKQVTGRIITGAHSGDSFTFLSQSVPIWSKSTDVRRNPLSSEVPPQQKLLGHHKLPLSISLPRQVNVPNDRGGADTCPLPETFLERHTPASIQYDFTILISRGKLRADSQ